ncbi:hypothetical protein H8739_02075 [Blautia faecis]|uniref:hypothetical protein n=1 Tax=Blautia faecis TaxID=871665 RepID=UPI0016559CE2|nr:hypothetical protein [Blautia faecis]MBC8612507.1 hypothetical protein [Blautia faecis]
MIEVIKRHLAERNMLKTAGLSLCYLEKKGEEKCVRAAEAIIQNEVMDVIPSLWEQVCLYMMEDPETITYLGNLKKEGCELNAYRFQRILLDAGTDKVSDFSYEQVKAVYFDPLVTDGTAYSYMKYYGEQNVSKEEKEQLVKSIAMCMEVLDFEKAGEKDHMLLVNPVFSSELLLDLLENVNNLKILQDQGLMELVNTLAGYEAEIQSLNQKQFDQMKERPVEILEKLRIVTGYIPKDKLTDGLNLWLWNEALYEDLCKLERAFTDGADPAEVFSSKVSYVNTLYQNPLSKISLSSLSVEKSELLLYAITQKKKAFLNLINEEPELFYDLLNASMLLKKEMYQEYINLNTLNRKNLKDSADLILSNDRFELLAKREHTFEELKLLCTAKEALIRLYEQLTCKCDERLLVLRELIKRECVPYSFWKGQIEPLAAALSKKPLSRWIREDFRNISDLSYGTALWLLVYREQLKGMEKEITMEQQALYLLKNLVLVKECDSLSELKEKLILGDVSWRLLKEKLSFSEEFVQNNAARIGNFLFVGGAEIMETFLERQPSKIEEIRRLVTAELLGKFDELKYPSGDLMREIDFEVSEEAEKEWKIDRTFTSKNLVLKEETGLLPVMQIGEVPSYSCLSYRSGLNSDCLLSCFDSNKKFFFIRKNGQVVFRAMIRLTKGSYVGDRMRKKIQFADLSGAGKPKEEEGEESVLFLERYYEKNLTNEEMDQAVYLVFVAAKEKAKKLGARLVLSCYYQDDVKTKEYIKSNYYLYISKSKNGSQYLDSLYGEASVSASGDYSSNIFLLENKEQEVAA